MDSFKYAASLNEWDTWVRHHHQVGKHPVQSISHIGHHLFPLKIYINQHACMFSSATDVSQSVLPSHTSVASDLSQPGEASRVLKESRRDTYILRVVQRRRRTGVNAYNGAYRRYTGVDMLFIHIQWRHRRMPNETERFVGL